MTTTGRRTGSDSTKGQQAAPRQTSQLRDSPERQSRGLSALDPEALQAGMAWIRQSLPLNPLADAYPSILQPAAIEMQLEQAFATANQVSKMFAADRQCIQTITAGISIATAVDTLLEADRERQKRLTEALEPCRGLLEGLRSQTGGWEQIAEASSASYRRLAETCSPRLAPLDIDLGIDAIRSLGTVGAFARLADLHGPMRIHAVPRLAPRLWVAQESESEDAPAPTDYQEPERPPGLLDGGAEPEDSQRLLEELIRFQRSDEITSDARDGMQALITWWQLHPRITPEQSLAFNRTVQRFIGTQLGLMKAPDGRQQLGGGLLVPRIESRRQIPAVELDPRIYTTLELSKIVSYSDSIIRRKAETAWAKAGGIGPCPLEPGSEWYVVVAAKDGGGRNCGWKLQQCLAPEKR